MNTEEDAGGKTPQSPARAWLRDEIKQSLQVEAVALPLPVIVNLQKSGVDVRGILNELDSLNSNAGHGEKQL